MQQRNLSSLTLLSSLYNRPITKIIKNKREREKVLSDQCMYGKPCARTGALSACVLTEPSPTQQFNDPKSRFVARDNWRALRSVTPFLNGGAHPKWRNVQQRQASPHRIRRYCDSYNLKPRSITLVRSWCYEQGTTRTLLYTAP